MRLWHKDLIDLLPGELLTNQWRELCLIAKSISEKGTPGNSAVNKISDYDNDHFCTYCKLICNEMHKRNYTCKLDSIIPKWFEDSGNVISNDELFKNWHTDRYLKQCFYALEEKYDNGSLSDEEFTAIKERCKKCFVDEDLKKQTAVKLTGKNVSTVSLTELQKMLQTGRPITLTL